MINTGIIRKIDDLGRIVLPKELRKNLNINSGDDLQIIIDNEKIILEKYSKLENYEDSLLEIIKCFSDVNNYKIFITVNDKIINYNKENINNIISNIILSKKIYINYKNELNIIGETLKEKGKIIIFPIVLESDLLGSIIIVGNDDILNLEKTVKILFNIVKKILK